MNNLVYHQPSNPMGRSSSSKSSLQFWLLIIASVLLSALVISLFLKVVKVMLYLLFVLLLVPFIYLLLKRTLAQGFAKDRFTKLKTRD
ncbi:hypothetical protein TH61_08680 [Rufibacter sp. DG15C]|uniref:hypothetical protein n=1 Tax=Rufibacter sp. DG15C TaxID=1379909 RepID=UPI00078B2030|nr:hypothetical protein [Rufibacter sp. DG15C]AMM51236.1 hypothetical protein TH61_08680 [Rufibacter sp. DG15C]